MKHQLILFALLISTTTVYAQLDSRYHTFPELQETLFNLEQQYPYRIAVDSIGHSQQDSLPIYLVKISDEVQVDHDRPTVMFVTHIHGEEILGIEIGLDVINDLVTNERPQYRLARQQLEIYFIPTMNPEGLNVVHGIGDPEELILGADYSYRKNKRDNVGDGRFRYQISGDGGNDTSGVDLNRNFEPNWIQGDSLYTGRPHNEWLDYYKGHSPFSEAEVKAVVKAFKETQPLFGTTIHSSRQGQLSEWIYYPWDWGGDGDKVAPDQDILDDFATEFALKCDKQGGGHFTPGRSGGRNGKMHDWSYAWGGWITVETETSSIQPDSIGIEEIIVNTRDALYYCINRARNANDLQGNKGHIKVTVTDPEMNPLVAEVLFPERHNGYLLPRYSDATFGVHRRAFLQGAYDIVVRKFGYETYEALAYVGQGAETPHNVTLNPKPTHTLTLEIMDLDSEEALSGHVIFHHEEWWVDTVSVDNGMFVQDWPQGMYTAEVWAEGDYIPGKFEFTIEDDDLTVRAGLVQFQHNLLDDFEGDEVPARWRSGHEGFAWGRSGMEAFGGDISLESHPGDFIPANSTGYARVGYRIPEGSQGYAIRGMHRYELEPDFDYCYVEYSFDEADWMPLDTLNGYQNYIPNRWQPFFYDLTDELVMDGNVYVRWRIETDGTDTDRGVFLDDVEFLATNELAVFEQSNELPAGFSLDSIYPNPFNPGTTVKFTVPTNAMVQVAVFDVLGREVLKVLDREVTAGSHRVTIDMSDFSSGLYFAKMQAPGFSDSRKLMLVK